MSVVTTAYALRVSSIEQLVSGERISIPIFSCPVPAGFPSPSDDFIEKNIDLNEWLIHNKLATYIVRVDGNSMYNEIHSGDRLIVDRSLEPRHKDVVIASLDGEMTVKRLNVRDGRYFLVADNTEYQAIEIVGETELIIWGVVTHSIHKLR